MPARVVHLHPTRFCNLACQHCYSSSGPTVRGELEPHLILSTLATLRAEGYEVLSLSGGEPLLYSHFKEVASAAVANGFRVNLITNGAPVGGHLLKFISENVNLVAVSLDGGPDTHNDLRGDPQAFARAERALDRLSKCDVKYGIAFCVSRESLADMPWAVEFAKEKGAQLVQFHPFAATGRGKRLANRLGLSDGDMARAYVIASLLEGDDLTIQLDLAPVEIARAQRDTYTVLTAEDPDSRLLSDLVNPLIIDEYGHVFPLCYGISRRLEIGQLGPGFTTSIARYRMSGGHHDLQELLDGAFSRLGEHGEQYTDWFFHLVQTSLLESPVASRTLDSVQLEAAQ